jgi:C4-dicarboxylate-binding protein DctP
MRKLNLILIIALVLSLIALQPAIAAELIKCGHGHSTSHPYHKCFEMFKELIEMKTDDYKVEIFPNNQLGNEAEMTEMTKLGTLHAGIFGRFESMGKQLYTATLPFLFKDYDHVNRVFNSPIGDFLASFAQDNGLKIGGWVHSGFRQITNDVRPIKLPADLKGLKMRTPPLENILQTMQAFGANATSIAYSELYMALKTGVVDGQENPYVNIVSEKMYEVQKYCTEVNYIYMFGGIVFSLNWWNSLPPEDQEMIGEIAKVVAMYTNYITEANAESNKQRCIDEGMVIYEPTDEERQAFMDMVQPVYDFFIKDGSSTQMLIELIQNS